MRPRPGGFSFCTGQQVALARYSGSAHDAVSRCGWNPDYPHSDEAGKATDRDRAASLAELEPRRDSFEIGRWWTAPNRERPSSTEAMSSLALVIVADVIAFVLIAAGLASRIPDFTVAGSVLGCLAFAVSLRWLWRPD
jgi:hypothetical protein